MKKGRKIEGYTGRKVKQCMLPISRGIPEGFIKICPIISYLQKVLPSYFFHLDSEST